MQKISTQNIFCSSVGKYKLSCSSKNRFRNIFEKRFSFMLGSIFLFVFVLASSSYAVDSQTVNTAASFPVDHSAKGMTL